jgi:hypothetical protein
MFLEVSQGDVLGHSLRDFGQRHPLSHHNAQWLKQCFSRGELSERQSKDLSLLESGRRGFHACTGQLLDCRQPDTMRIGKRTCSF